MSGYEEAATDSMVLAIRNALWSSEPIRALSLDQIQVDVKDGLVELRGIVASVALKHAAERMVRKVPGVKAVANHLVTDEELELQIAAALAAHPDLRRHRISVSVTEGVASLYGAVSSAAESEEARKLALGVSNVVGVENNLHVLDPDSPVILAWQRSLEGRPWRAPEQPEAGPAQSGAEAAAAPVEG